MDVFVARQPIFDRKANVYAYELLYRSNAHTNQFTETDEDGTTLDVIASSLLSIGLNSIVPGTKAFINFGRNLLVDGLVSMLPKDRVVIEVLESTEPDPEVLNSCRKFRDLGYTIALDDFVWHPRFEQLISIAHLIKLDMRTTSRAEQQRLLSKYRPGGIAFLAEKVETLEEFEWASRLGYDYFQGYFFARPAIIAGKDIQPSVVTCLELLRELQNPEVDFKKVEEFIAQDVSLTYKLFRYVNSALFAQGGNAKSICGALLRLGEDGIRRWVTIATLHRMAKNKPAELVACALLRARFSESLARAAGDPGIQSAYLTGLFSLLGALLDRPIEEALAEIGLAHAIREVLLGTAPPDTPASRIYALVRSYESGDWDRVEHSAHDLGISGSQLSDLYVEATNWTNLILNGGNAPAAKPATPAARRHERRLNRRDPMAASVPVAWGIPTQQEQLAQAQLVDVSAFGAKLRLSTPIPAGAWLAFYHRKTGVGGRGKVHYCRTVKGGYEIGIEVPDGTGWGTPRAAKGDLVGVQRS
jgi:EAL and modified HD-GYP domain-containing signal transduction protein